MLDWYKKPSDSAQVSICRAKAGFVINAKASQEKNLAHWLRKK